MNFHRSCPSLRNWKQGLMRQFTVNVSVQQKQNHYDSLGITPKATQGDIKSAYYKLSKEYHPDLNEGDESAAAKFRNITAAYEVLGNVKSRKVYDRGLLVGSYQHDYEGEAEPPVETYPHAPFYHHRNKPSSVKSRTGTTTNYDIDEWTRAHYSKAFEKRYNMRAEAKYYKADTENTDEDTWRNLPTISIAIILTACFLMYGTDANKKFDTPSKIDYKPD